LIDKPFALISDFQLWYRGKITYTKSYRTWRTLFLLKTQKFHLFDRLVVMYRRRPEAVVGPGLPIPVIRIFSRATIVSLL